MVSNLWYQISESSCDPSLQGDVCFRSFTFGNSTNCYKGSNLIFQRFSHRLKAITLHQLSKRRLRHLSSCPANDGSKDQIALIGFWSMKRYKIQGLCTSLSIQLHLDGLALHVVPFRWIGTKLYVNTRNMAHPTYLSHRYQDHCCGNWVTIRLLKLKPCLLSWFLS